MDLKNMVPVHTPRRTGSWLKKGFLTQVFIGVPMADRIAKVLLAERISISDYIRVACDKLLREYEEDK